MKELVLENGIKLIYEKSMTQLTSISIGLEAGASVEKEVLGLAHATEHMLFKGTKTRSESDINKELSKIFGFHNAMTNYPYVIYYGTLLGEDFEKGVEIFSDILINPTFPVEGFKEEMDTIIEELKEWDEELDQYCEDKLFIHSFNENRLKYPIIGRYEDVSSITLKDIKGFYNRYYSPKNTRISVISSLGIDEVKSIIEKYFLRWQGEAVEVLESTELPKVGVYRDIKEGINTCRVQLIFSISKLNHEEIKGFRLFNEFFGEGVNSVLFDNLRTKNGLVYDVLTSISNESHIGLYKITFNTSEEKLDKALDIVRESIENIDKYKEVLTKEKIKELSKSIKLKKLFKEEQSIRLANNLATYSVMFKDYRIYEGILDGMEEIEPSKVIDIAKRVLKNPSIEIITPR
ncbi:M16 family metallopeptidase [Clostridium paraputrificum]|uniref:M16 family metallopeptidase n=1 Tax=Clostridium paraputrificum TaxID=29363 RepID=UPI003D336457